MHVWLTQRRRMTFVIVLQFWMVLIDPLKAAEPSSTIQLEDFAKVESKPISVASGVDESSVQRSKIADLIADTINVGIQRWSTEKILQGGRTLIIQPEIVQLQLGNHALFRNSHFRLRLTITDSEGRLLEEREYSEKANGAASVFTKGRSDSRMYKQVSAEISTYLEDLSFAARERIQQSLQEQISKRIAAADAGDISEQVALGNLYFSGKEVQRDAAQAVTWWRRAAEQGNGESQLSLGLALATGQGVQQDDDLAVFWIRKAAVQGLAEAQWQLASLLDAGRGHALNEGEAEKWWLEAARQGISVAQDHVKQRQNSINTNAAALAAPSAMQTFVDSQPAPDASSTSMNPLLMILLIVMVLVLSRLARAYFRRKTCEGALAKVNSIALQHATALARRHAQLVTNDAYGKPQLDKWEKELSHFLNTHVAPELTSNEKNLYHMYSSQLVSVVMHHVNVETEQNQYLLTPIDARDMSPTDYEVLCANELRKGGWTATTTKGSGDQGVDVIAERNGVRLILQCKFYTNPVGNKAVQEAAAGRAHEGAHYAAVVSNSTFTEPAKQLARTNRILLLHLKITSLFNMKRYECGGKIKIIASIEDQAAIYSSYGAN